MDDIIVKRLSHNKISVSYDLIISTLGDSEEPIEEITRIRHTFVYKKWPDTLNYMPLINGGFIAGLCGKWGIKKKYVTYFPLSTQDVQVDGEWINVSILKMFFTDGEWIKAWRRNKRIDSIL